MVMLDRLFPAAAGVPVAAGIPVAASVPKKMAFECAAVNRILPRG